MPFYRNVKQTGGNADIKQDAVTMTANYYNDMDYTASQWGCDGLAKVYVQSHTHTSTTSVPSNTNSYDLGTKHNVRYINGTSLTYRTSVLTGTIYRGNYGSNSFYSGLDNYETAQLTIVARELHKVSLWSNSDVGASTTGLTATLSESMTNFDLLLFTWYATTSSNANTLGYFYVPVSTFIAESKSTSNGGNVEYQSKVILAGINSSGTKYFRGAYYKSDTQITFGNAQRANSTGDASSSACIPEGIYGVICPTII